MNNSTKILAFSAVCLVLILIGFSVFRKQTQNEPAVLQISPQNSPSASQISYDCVKDKTALELLENKFTTETKVDSIGTMVVGINEIKPKDRQFWAFLIDGKEATIGASAYKCLENEKIEWKLESY